MCRPALALYGITNEFVASRIRFCSPPPRRRPSETIGKLWPRMYKVKLRDGEEDGGEEVAEGPESSAGSSDGNARA